METNIQTKENKSLPNLEIVLKTLEERKSRKIGEIVLSNNPTIGRLVNKYSYSETLALTIGLIFKFISQINVGKNMNDKQILSCAESLMGTYHLYKLDDFYKALQNGIEGKYGQLFDRVDISVIFGWFKLYDLERTEAIENERIRQASSQKVNPMDIEIGILPKEKLKEFTGFEPDNHLKALFPDQEWMKEFDSMPQTTFGGKRFVEVDGKMMDLTEFLEYKIKPKE